MLAPDLSILGNSTTFWQASLHAAPSAAPDAGTKAAGQEAESVVLSVGTVSTAPDGGERITVGGRPARFVTEVSAPKPPLIRSSVVVDLGAGMLLTVSGSSSAVGRADLVRIAEGARVDDDADLSWLGTR
jgi:hypothetical protein